LVRVRAPGGRRNIIGEDEGAEEPDFGEKESEDARLIVIGKNDLIVANDWIRPIRIFDIPQRSTAVDRWQRDKFSCGGGEVVAHSRVHAFHGLSPATFPRKNECAMFQPRPATRRS